MKCKNCKCWERDKWEEYLGYCNHPKFTYGEYRKEIPKDGVNYYDADDYSATLRTGEDFGCIHFEEGQYLKPKVGEFLKQFLSEE